MRSIFATVGHISFSGYMGIAFYIHKKIHPNNTGLILSLCIASLAHGLYDGFLFHKEITLFFYVVYTALIFLQLWFLRLSLGFSKFRKIISMEIFEETGKKTFLNCCVCNINIESNEISFEKIKAGVCPSCNSLVLNYKNTLNMLHYFRPTLRAKRFLKKLQKVNRIASLDTEKTIVFDTKTKCLVSPIFNLSIWLKGTNETDKQEILSIPIIGTILYYIGIRYLR